MNDDSLVQFPFWVLQQRETLESALNEQKGQQGTSALPAGKREEALRDLHDVPAAEFMHISKWVH